MTANKKVKQNEMFLQWYEESMPDLYRYLLYRLGNTEQAEEATAHICERALRILDRFDPSKGTLDGWIFGIARNELRQQFRDQSRRPILISLDAVPQLSYGEASVESRYHLRETYEKALGFISAMPEREQEILSLRYGAGIGNKEIASMLGLGENHVAVVLHRALKKLQRAFEADEKDLLVERNVSHD